MRILRTQDMLYRTPTALNELASRLLQPYKNSATGTRTRVARVRAEYPNQLDYSGSCTCQYTLTWVMRQS